MPASDSAIAIETRGLVKTYGEHRALDGVHLSVPTGTVLGLLGPNGAGKTTAVRILATVLRPDAGEARVLGIDVAAHPDVVRTRIGLAGQYAAVDGNLTGRENLRLIGTLTHLRRRDIAPRAKELLERFGLTDAADRPVAHLLRRHAPAPRPRRGARPPAAGPVPRRAHHRPRSPEPQRPLGHRPRAGGRRHHRPPHDPVPRGGRPAGEPDRP